MKKLLASAAMLVLSLSALSQSDTGNAKAQYQAAQKAIGRSFSNYFYPNYSRLYSLPEKTFIARIDSARNVFDSLLLRYKPRLDKTFVEDEITGIKYYFDKLIIDHPGNHETYAGQPVVVSGAIQQLLRKNLPDINKPSLLANNDLKEYVKAFLYFHESAAHRKGLYKKRFRN